MQLNIQQQLGNLRDKRFLPLGEVAQIPLADLTGILRKDGKLNKDRIWGTLGWEDDRPFTPEGDLVFSRLGNSDEGFNGESRINVLTRQEIADLKAVNPDLSIRRKKEVHEYYINFDDVHFTLPEVFNPIELPRLRLAVFLEPNEGAIVYFQRSKKGDFWDKEAFSEYILYDKIQPTNRDRLNYYFPVEPKHILEPADEEKNLYRESEKETGLSFIVKVLVFKQKKGTERQLYSRFLKAINSSKSNNSNLLYELVGKDKYSLLKFHPKVNRKPLGEFIPVTKQKQIEQDAKTLLLIHGTFVDTLSSFEQLLTARPSGKCFLQELLAKGKFDQVLAFNHPTISHNAQDNITWLATHLKKLNIRFSKPVQIIATSRGALAAEYMASNTSINEYIPVISKIMVFSAGNGCGYFKLGDKISRVLSIWKATTAGPAGKVISSIAQLSVEWFLKQPGCIMMNENHPELESILSRSPVNRNIRYKSVVSDWHRCLVNEKGFFKRIGSTSLDAVIRVALGKEHDWVIGVEQQKRIPVNSGAPDEDRRHSVHGRYLEPGYVRDENCKLLADPHQIIFEYFD